MPTRMKVCRKIATASRPILRAAGFDSLEIDKAFDWLDGLAQVEADSGLAQSATRYPRACATRKALAWPTAHRAFSCFSSSPACTDAEIARDGDKPRHGSGFRLRGRYRRVEMGRYDGAV